MRAYRRWCTSRGTVRNCVLEVLDFQLWTKERGEKMLKTYRYNRRCQQRNSIAWKTDSCVLLRGYNAHVGVPLRFASHTSFAGEKKLNVHWRSNQLGNGPYRRRQIYRARTGRVRVTWTTVVMITCGGAPRLETNTCRTFNCRLECRCYCNARKK